MASIRNRPNGTFELKFSYPTFSRPHWTTHDTRDAAETYDDRLRKTLDAGVVPPELLSLLKTATPAPRKGPAAPRMSQVLREYLNEAPIARSDVEMVQSLQSSITIRTDELTVLWCDDWVKRMKRVDYLAPGTIRKKVESLARAYDWWLRKTQVAVPVNPLRLFPKGYSTYKDGDAPDGEEAREDVKRNRRLDPAEVPRIEAVILGAKRVDRERGLGIEDRASMLLFWRLIVNTGMRLREAYSLRVRDIRFDLKTIHIARSKMTRGKKLGARDIPMTREVYGWLKAHDMPRPNDLVFPFWNGDEEDLERTSNKLSQLFGRVFDHAEVENLTEHDLRHEAVCRWMMLKDDEGRWTFRPEEVRRITGHSNVQQFERYLSLRGSDLADRLWD